MKHQPKKPRKLKTNKPINKPAPEFVAEKGAPGTEGQKQYLRTICENQITICIGPAGTGKGFIAMHYAIQHLLGGQCNKIILTRPVVSGGMEELGALPGDTDSKLSPYIQSLLDSLKKFISYTQISEIRNSKALEFIALSHTRGRTYDNCVVIFDEMQNANIEQLKMALTRIGKNCKLIILGDIKQSDLKQKERGALDLVIGKLDGVEGIGIVKLTNKDIMRNEIIGRILDRLEE